MYGDKKVVVVMPAYNAARTLPRTYEEVRAQGVVDTIIVVDDGSQDQTASIARDLPGVKLFVHPKNLGYGASQKACYRLALAEEADIVVMVHPDYQYTPRLIPALVALVGNEVYPCVLGSRILGGQALAGGMPLWKYLGNRILTLVENLFTGAKLSEYHSGYRAFSRALLQEIPWEANADGFVFDNQVLAQVLWFGHTVGEISCPARYFPEASSLGLRVSLSYGFGCLLTALTFRLAGMGLVRSARFPRPLSGRRRLKG